DVPRERAARRGGRRGEARRVGAAGPAEGRVERGAGVVVRRRPARRGRAPAVHPDRRLPARLMALAHPRRARPRSGDIAVAPIFTLESERVPRHRLPEAEMPPEVAYQIIHDELMLDGNARMNLATFVTTWMEPQAERLMAECLDKNMIDKDEYPQ